MLLVMKSVIWIFAAVFGLVFLGATLMNAALIARSRNALGRSVLRQQAPSAPVRYQLLVILPDTTDSFFQGLLEGINESAPKAAAAVQVFTYPSASPAEAEPYFEIALKAKVDGLIMFTPRNDRIADRAQTAARNGVVFIPVGTDAPAGSPPSFIGAGSLRQGLEGGRRICTQLGSAARIGVILPMTGSGPATNEPIYRGLAAAIKTFPPACIVAAERPRPGVLSGEETASAMLRAYPSINALFCSSSQDTVSAAQVVVDMNKVGRVLIIGADETPEIHRYIQKGVIAASIMRDSKWIGREAVAAFVRLKESNERRGPVQAGFSVSSVNESAR
jgi:ribose transport system substrate-binding protein